MRSILWMEARTETQTFLGGRQLCPPPIPQDQTSSCPCLLAPPRPYHADSGGCQWGWQEGWGAWKCAHTPSSCHLTFMQHAATYPLKLCAAFTNHNLNPIFQWPFTLVSILNTVLHRDDLGQKLSSDLLLLLWHLTFLSSEWKAINVKSF